MKRSANDPDPLTKRYDPLTKRLASSTNDPIVLDKDVVMADKVWGIKCPITVISGNFR